MNFTWPDPCLNVVLVEPEIPPNTGNIARTCAATGTRLHLVEPLGFSMEDKHLKRAGLDYWPHVDLHVHPSLDACLKHVPETSVRFHLATAGQSDPDPNPAPESSGSAQVWWFSKKATRLVYTAEFRPGDWLVFGPETRGLSDAQLARAGNNLLALPMRGDAVRSLNLGTSAGVALYEALRQCR